jgi:hypothetical protein
MDSSASAKAPANPLGASMIGTCTARVPLEARLRRYRGLVRPAGQERPGSCSSCRDISRVSRQADHEQLRLRRGRHPDTLPAGMRGGPEARQRTTSAAGCAPGVRDAQGRSRRLAHLRALPRQAFQLHGLHQLRARTAPGIAAMPGHRLRLSLIRSAMLAEPGSTDFPSGAWPGNEAPPHNPTRPCWIAK